MAIARVQDAAFDHDSGSTGAWAVILGGAPSSGHVLYAVTGVIGTSVTFTAPSGWTSVKAETTNANIRLELWRKVAGGSEPSSYAWTPSIGAKGFAWVGEYSGVDTSTPEDASASGTNSSSVTTALASVTVGVANAWTITAAIGRHTFTGVGQAFSTSDGSDSARHSHGANSGSGSDYTGVVYDSNRALSAGADASTLTSNTTENAISWLALSMKPSGAALTAGVYESHITVPQAAPDLRAGIYTSSITAPAPSGGLTAGIYRHRIYAPAVAGHTGPSGIYIQKDGVWHPVTVRVQINGEF